MTDWRGKAMSLICSFPCHVSQSFCHQWCYDLIDVTLTCEDSHNLSKSHAISPSLTICTSTLKQSTSHVVYTRRKQIQGIEPSLIIAWPCLASLSLSQSLLLLNFAQMLNLSKVVKEGTMDPRHWVRPFNTFSSSQTLLQVLKSWFTSSLVLFVWGQEIHRKALTNPSPNFKKSSDQLWESNVTTLT